MKILIILSLCICMTDLYASDTESKEISPIALSIVSSSHDQDDTQGDVRINMDQFTASMPQEATPSPRSLILGFNGSKDVAQYFTQVAYGDTIALPAFLTGPVRNHLKKMQTENPIKYERLINQLIEHKTKSTRGINITGATQALQKEITPEMMGLLINAWETSHTQQTGTITEQEQAARTARIQLWCTVGTTVLGVAGTVIAAIFAGTGTC